MRTSAILRSGVGQSVVARFVCISPVRTTVWDGEFVDYYHDCRPHQGIGNRLIGADDSDAPPEFECVEQLECESRLGGLLKTYRRAA